MEDLAAQCGLAATSLSHDQDAEFWTFVQDIGGVEARVLFIFVYNLVVELLIHFYTCAGQSSCRSMRGASD